MAHNLIVNYGLCDEVEEDAPEINGEGERKINGIENGHSNGDLRADGSEERWNKALLSGGRGKAMQVFVSPLAGFSRI